MSNIMRELLKVNNKTLWVVLVLAGGMIHTVCLKKPDRYD